MARFIAFYLPQFHPTPENDEWWGPGFTEWVNVAKARPLFRGHKQPHIPADLGFYDLRLPETRERQAELARDAGVEGFCYYHYWFGNGKQLLERPFNEVLSSGNPDFPFCLCWANHSWYRKLWDLGTREKDKLLIEQTYPGEDDYVNHFYTLLPAFKDRRYLKVNGRLLFLVYDALHFSDVDNFIHIWRNLAKQNGLNDFYFAATDSDSRSKDFILSKGFDAIYNVDTINMHHHMPKLKKGLLMFMRKYLKKPTVLDYRKAMQYMINDDCKSLETIPCIEPNWDHSPRSSTNAFVLQHSKPEYFKQLVIKAIHTVSGKPKDEQIIFIKSWNEWGEGNYLEPDIDFGHGYLNALREAIMETND